MAEKITSDQACGKAGAEKLVKEMKGEASAFCKGMGDTDGV